MVTFEAKMKINDIDHIITCTANNKLCIPEALELALTSDELVKLLTLIKSLIFWMDTAAKKEFNLKRTD